MCYFPVYSKVIQIYNTYMGFPGSTNGKESACQCRRCKRHRFDPVGGEEPLAREMATCSSILAWKIPWTEELGGLQSHGLSKSQTRLNE